MFDIRVSLVLGTSAIMFGGCTRNLGAFENPEAVERQTGGKLCKSTKVVLVNKQELVRYVEADNFRYKISGSGRCLHDYSRSLFGEQARMCQVGSLACHKFSNGKNISLAWQNDQEIEINIWS